MTIPKTVDAIIIGGGVMGASTLYHLSLRGFKNIILLEKDEFFGQGATGRCAGGVRYQFSTPINVELSKQSLPMLERFKIETGQDIDYRKCGYLFVLTNKQDDEYFARNVQMQNSLGVGTVRLNADQVHAMVPSMTFPDAISGSFNSNDGLVDPNGVVMGYINAALRNGASAENKTTVTGLLVDHGKINGVQTNQGDISSPVVINAAGPWSALIGEMAGVKIPVTPVRRQMFTTSKLPDLPKDFPFVIDFAQSLYFHREGEGLLSGMSNPRQLPGYDQNVDDAFELINLEAAIARMPMIEKAGMVSHWAGLYEVTPDSHPIFGKTPIDGFLLVTGFSGHGFMHGPISGKLMAEYVLDGQFKSMDVSMLDLARFDEGRAIKEYNVV